MCLEFGIGGFQGMSGVLSRVFLFLLFVNSFGLFPATFRISSQFLYTIILAVPLWLAMLIITYRKKPIQKFGGYIGTGIPSGLGPIIGVCEVVRILVRPIALGLRLGANILAGHAILALITNCFRYGMINLSALRSLAFFIVSFGFFLFEAAVCIIQAYVFILLLRIYVSEYPL